jgi:hypothetical protein
MVSPNYPNYLRRFFAFVVQPPSAVLWCFLVVSSVSSPVEQENNEDTAKNSRGRLYHNGKEPPSTCHP